MKDLTARKASNGKPVSFIATVCNGVRAYVDLIPRRRNWWGDRLGNHFAYRQPYSDGTPIGDTPLAGTLKVINEVRPGQAGLIAYLHTCYTATLRRFELTRDEADAALRAWNERATVVNGQIDTEQAKLRAQAGEAARAHLARALALEGPLDAAHDRAVEAVASTGRSYDPSAPNAEVVLTVPLPDPGECAAALNLPDPVEDAKVVYHPALMWLFTVGIGLLLGLSLGVLGGAIEPSELDRHIVPTLVFWLVACSPAALMRKAVFLAHRKCGERAYLKCSWRERFEAVAFALTLDLVVLGVDVVVEWSGLLKALQQGAALSGLGDGTSGVTAGDPTTLAAALLVTLGYVTYTAQEGYLAGRRAVVANLIKQEQQKRHALAQAAHLARPEVLRAAAAIQRLQDLLHQIATHERHAREAAQPFREQIERLEKKRLPYHEGYTDKQEKLIQDGCDNTDGAHRLLVSTVQREIHLVEPQDRGFSDLIKALFAPGGRDRRGR